MLRASLLVLSLGVPSLVNAAEPPGAGPQTRPCEGEAQKVVGQRAVVAGKDFHAPRKLQGGPFDYPTRPGATKASGIWVGEALVDGAGKVRAVWTIRPIRFEPAWPAFDDAITAGIRGWTYEPSLVDGAAVPVCMLVSVNIDWR